MSFLLLSGTKEIDNESDERTNRWNMIEVRALGCICKPSRRCCWVVLRLLLSFSTSHTVPLIHDIEGCVCPFPLSYSLDTITQVCLRTRLCHFCSWFNKFFGHWHSLKRFDSYRWLMVDRACSRLGLLWSSTHLAALILLCHVENMFACSSDPGLNLPRSLR